MHRHDIPRPDALVQMRGVQYLICSGAARKKDAHASFGTMVNDVAGFCILMPLDVYRGQHRGCCLQSLSEVTRIRGPDERHNEHDGR